MTLDLKKDIVGYTARPSRFDIVRIPPLRFLMADGHGDPNTSADYREAIAALYPMAYALKFLSRSELGRDHVVMPLEALWWSDDMDTFTISRDKSRWDWTLMIMVPDWILAEHIDAARATTTRRGRRADRVRFGQLDEGMCVQTLHVGSYDDEGPVLASLHHVIHEQGLQLGGRHHEIYLSDARRTAPSKLRTILRQPVTDSP